MDVDDLNKILRDELSAVETYRQALDKNRSQYGTDMKFQQLDQMCRDHEEAAREVRSCIERLGGQPDDDSGAWGTWSKTIMGAAKLFGDKAALKALKEGEESGIKDYQEVLQNCPPDVRTTLGRFAAKDQQHIRELDRMMQSA